MRSSRPPVTSRRFSPSSLHPDRAWAEIDLDALAHNLARIRARAGAERATILVVKADAYGHGAVAIARRALACGVAAFAVGDSREALELREAGLRAPILVLGTIVAGEEVCVARRGIEVGLHATDRLRSLRRAAALAGRRVGVHLNVDTGMARLGVSPLRAGALLAEILRAPELRLAGIMTHFASTNGWHDAFAAEQSARFGRFLRDIARLGARGARVHAANSAALFTGVPDLHDAVRPGTAAYGVLPEELAPGAGLRPVLSLRTRIVFLKDLPAGATVGYDRAFVARRGTRVATVPIGYADGVPWRLCESGEVLVRGARAPIAGRISMDTTTIDVGSVRGVRVGDPVTILGRDGEEEISVHEIAARAGTHPLEVLCGIGRRVRRVVRASTLSGPAARPVPTSRVPVSARRIRNRRAPATVLLAP